MSALDGRISAGETPRPAVLQTVGFGTAQYGSCPIASVTLRAEKRKGSHGSRTDQATYLP